LKGNFCTTFLGLSYLVLTYRGSICYNQFHHNSANFDAIYLFFFCFVGINNLIVLRSNKVYKQWLSSTKSPSRRKTQLPKVRTSNGKCRLRSLSDACDLSGKKLDIDDINTIEPIRLQIRLNLAKIQITLVFWLQMAINQRWLPLSSKHSFQTCFLTRSIMH